MPLFTIHFKGIQLNSNHPFYEMNLEQLMSLKAKEFLIKRSAKLKLYFVEQH